MISSFFHMLRGARVGFVLAREGALALVDPSVLPPLARGLIRVGRLIERHHSTVIALDSKAERLRRTSPRFERACAELVRIVAEEMAS